MYCGYFFEACYSDRLLISRWLICNLGFISLILSWIRRRQNHSIHSRFYFSRPTRVALTAGESDGRLYPHSHLVDIAICKLYLDGLNFDNKTPKK